MVWAAMAWVVRALQDVTRWAAMAWVVRALRGVMVWVEAASDVPVLPAVTMMTQASMIMAWDYSNRDTGMKAWGVGWVVGGRAG